MGASSTGCPRGELTAWRARHCGYIFQLYHLVPIFERFRERGAAAAAGRPAEPTGAACESGCRPRAGWSGRPRAAPAERAVRRAGATGGDLGPPPPPPGRSWATPGCWWRTSRPADLDREAATQILDLLQRLCGELGKTIVMVTHDAVAAGARRAAPCTSKRAVWSNMARQVPGKEAGDEGCGISHPGLEANRPAPGAQPC